MVFRWLKELGAKPGPESEESGKDKRPSGLGTIDLNPFGSMTNSGDFSDSSTLVMPELDDDGATEVWRALDDIRSEPPAPLQEMIELERDADECIPFNLRLMPTLRTMANSLRLAAESAYGETASQRWRAYLQLVPSDSGAWLSLGEHHLEQGELSDAKKVFAKAVEREPEDGITKGALGHTLLMLGEVSEARRCLEEACEQMPEEIGLHETLLECLRADGDAEAAQRQASLIEDLRRGL